MHQPRARPCAAPSQITRADRSSQPVPLVVGSIHHGIRPHLRNSPGHRVLIPDVQPPQPPAPGRELRPGHVMTGTGRPPPYLAPEIPARPDDQHTHPAEHTNPATPAPRLCSIPSAAISNIEQADKVLHAPWRDTRLAISPGHDTSGTGTTYEQHICYALCLHTTGMSAASTTT